MMGETSGHRHVFVALDGLRGAAALAVVALHSANLLGAHNLGAAGAAVDVFFIMSGIVIAHAYEHRLLGGMSVARFAWIRLVRLYPLYFFATAAFCTLAAGALVAGVALEKWDVTALSMAAMAALLALPHKAQGANALYPLNGPAWSLPLEFGANLIYAALVAHCTQLRLALTSAAGLLGLLVLTAFGFDPLNGSEWPTWPVGVARIAFGFPLGVLMYHRLRSRAAFGSRPTAGIAVLLLFLTILLAPGPSAFFTTAYHLVMIAVVAPLVVWLAATGSVTGRTGTRVCLFLGLISYPVYLLHILVMSVVAGAARAAGLDLAPLVPWPGLLVFAIVIPTAAIVARWVDQPVRSWLLRVTAQRKPAGRDD
jgi:peptidoglycan/LPS O-acetylase OafA/YrhL